MIRTRAIRVDYEGVTAVRDLDLNIPAGEIFGLIGPNGAGKTSTIRVLATLQEPTYGEVHIAGLDIAEHPARVRRILGYMPDLAPVYEDLKCWELLDLFAGAFHLPRAGRRARVDECLDLVNLREKREALAGTLSRGMKQRLVLAKTLLPDPQVLLLDEPASGLDPYGRIEMRDTLKRLCETGNTVLISSHILSELSGFCTSIGIMQRGRLLVSGEIDEIAGRLAPGRRLVVELLQPDERALALFDELEGVSVAERSEERVELDFAGTDAEAVELLRRLVREGLPVKAFHERHMDVEDILLQVGAREVM